MTGYGAAIFPQHARLLEASAISPEVAAERGYVSVDTKKRLESAGFRDYQRRVPGLLIPVHDTSGAVATWQYRPDDPRTTRAGKTVKYETPAGSRLALDVPPRVRGQLGDPSVPLWITEGARKADAAVSAGLCCIGLSGVDGWQGTNPQGGKTALADWKDIALNQRRVYLAFDSDAASNPKVAGALERLGHYLRRGADIRYCYLPAGPDGAKTGLDDYLAGGGSAGALIEASTPELVAPVQPELPNDGASHPPAQRAHLHTPPPLASDQDILRRVVVQLRVCRGLVGENRAAKLVYLAFTSRLLNEPVNAVVKGLSSSGKSYTIECVAVLLPPEAVYTMTAMSERALIYLGEPLSHRTLILYEAAALREGRDKAEDNMTAYVVRSLLSEGRIEYPVVVRGDDGQFRTETKVIPGPTNMVTSTTSVSLHGENETRMISIPSNDSKSQTRAVMAESAREKKRSAADFTEWHDLQRWLAGQETTEVVIPYAACVAAQIPPVAVRLRRDWNAVRSLIRAHAMLHQLNRKRDEHNRIIASRYDYTAVRSLIADLIADAVGATVPPSVRETVEVVSELEATSAEGHATVHHVAALLKVERPSAQRRLATARDSGYIVNTEDKRGKPAKYVTGDPLPGEVVVLPPADAICTPPCTHLGQGETAGQECDCTGVCRCADDAEG